MKKVPLCFIGAFCMACSGAMGAVNVRTAPAVSTKQASVQDTAASIAPTIMNIVSGVQQLSKKQQELTSECVPTTQEVNWVNNMIKEWAKTGAKTADEAFSGMPPRCSSEGEYRRRVQLGYGTDAEDDLCYDAFDDSGMVWDDFPKAAVADYCTDGSYSGCSAKNKKTVSNIYEIFALIDFEDKDYTDDEMTTLVKLREKFEKCGGGKLAAQKKQMWGEFLVDSIGGLGQKTNTATIMDAVSGMAKSGGGAAGLGSLGNIASQLLTK